MHIRDRLTNEQPKIIQTHQLKPKIKNKKTSHISNKASKFRVFFLRMEEYTKTLIICCL